MSEYQELSDQIDLLRKENQKLKEELQFNELFAKDYINLFQTMNEAVAIHELVYDESGKPVNFIIKAINSAFEKITGFQKTDVINKVADNVYPDYELKHIDIFARVAETGIPATIETHFESVDKYFKISVYSSEKGKFATIFEEITHRKHMEKAMRERMLALTQPIGDITNVHFSDLFNLDEIQKIQDTFADATGVASLITDPNGVPITKPSNFCNLCTNIIRKTPKGLANCMKSDSIIGKSSTNGPNIRACLSGGLYDGGASITVGEHHIANWLIGQVLDNDADMDKMRNYAKEIEVDEEVFMNELKFVKKMPKEQFYKIGEALFLIAKQISDLALNNLQQARAITERMKTEEKIKALNDELLDKNKELEQIVYVSSHDLRSPLVNIQGFSKELKEDFDKIKRILESGTEEKILKDKVISSITNEMTDSFDFIFRSTRKMDLLLAGLLRLSRLGRSAYKFEQIKMNELARDVIKTFEYQIAQAGFEVVVGDLPDCYGDEFMINQVFSNIIDNALKFCQPGRAGKIMVDGEALNENCIYSIKDNGIGIPKDYQNQIFELFRRLDPKVPGEGLGLAIVKKIIDRHNGSLWVESEVGEWSCFYFSLPFFYKL